MKRGWSIDVVFIKNSIEPCNILSTWVEGEYGRQRAGVHIEGEREKGVREVKSPLW